MELETKHRFTSSFSDFITRYTAVSSTNMKTETAEYYHLNPDDGLTMNLGVNPLLQFGLKETREQLCMNILNDLAVVDYVPFDSETIGNPSVEVEEVLAEGTAGNEETTDSGTTDSDAAGTDVVDETGGSSDSAVAAEEPVVIGKTKEQTLSVELPVVWKEDGQVVVHFTFEFNDSIYVMNSTQLATNDEDEHLEFVKSTIGRTPVIFVMNKIDSYNLEEEDQKYKHKDCSTTSRKYR